VGTRRRPAGVGDDAQSRRRTEIRSVSAPAPPRRPVLRADHRWCHGGQRFPPPGPQVGASRADECWHGAEPGGRGAPCAAAQGSV